MTTPIPSSSTSLSAVPNVETAKSFSQGGVASMNAPPTATKGDASGAMTAATSWATPRVTAAARTPASAANQVTWEEPCGVEEPMRTSIAVSARK